MTTQPESTKELLASVPGIQTGSHHGLEFLRVESALSSGQVFLQGGQVTHFQPKGGRECLFLSTHSRFEPRHPIRGGIPLVFPWFGPHPDRPQAPSHGFARTQPWRVLNADRTPSGGIEISLTLTETKDTVLLWPHRFCCTLTLRFETDLCLTWRVENCDTASFSFESAFHTYLSLADIHHISVEGLAMTEFIDQCAGHAQDYQSQSALHFSGEIDRIYLNTHGTCTVVDPTWSRRLILVKKGSQSTVVWNPWIDKARRLNDLGDEEWRQFVCVESGNLRANTIHLSPQTSHIMELRLREEPLPLPISPEAIL